MSSVFSVKNKHNTINCRIIIYKPIFLMRYFIMKGHNAKIAQVIQDSLKTKIFGKKLFYFDRLDSTNRFALANIEEKISDEGFAYITKIQTNGQGSYGSSWQSNSNFGLWNSIVVHSPYKHEPLTFVPAIALANMLKEYGINAHLKWPNDVLVGRKKISGILCQAKQLEGNRFACVVGVGLNVNHNVYDFTPELRDKAISMKMLTGKQYNVFEIFKSYVEHFEATYFDNTNIITQWKERSLMIGSTITGKHNGENFKAIVLDITDDGYLLVERDGKVQTLMSRGGLDIDTHYS